MDGRNVPFPGVGAGFDLVSCGNGCNDDFRMRPGRLDDSRGPDSDEWVLKRLITIQARDLRYLGSAEEPHSKCITAFRRIWRVEAIPTTFDESHCESRLIAKWKE